MTVPIRSTLQAACVALLSTQAVAADMGTLAQVTGQVLTNEQPALAGAALEPDMRIETGPLSTAVLEFPDRQTIILGENTRFVLRDFAYDPQSKKGRSITELASGALRQVSGLVATDNPGQVKVSTPMATLDVRDADFTAVTGSLYLRVNKGTVMSRNSAGTVAFGPGSTGFIGSAWSTAATITETQIPAAVDEAFTRLGGVPVKP